MWDQKCLIWVFLVKNFRKTIVIFEISTLGLVWLQNFVKKQKCLNLGPKMQFFGIFGLEFKKNYCHIWNRHPQVCLFAKFHGKTKMPKFGTKNAWFGYFGLEFENNLVIFEISTLEFVWLQNFAKKQKCLNLGPKIPCLCIFGQEF